MIGKILVTGAAGFVGWKVCEFLLRDGYRVVGIDNLNDAYDVRLKQWRLEQLEGRPGFEFIRLDICDRQALGDLVHSQLGTRHSGFDAVINLAARAGVRQSVENPWCYFETNVTGTLNLLEFCREFRVKRFLLASSSSVYGGSNPMPFREDANTDLPLSPYAASKKAAEALCYTYHYLYGLSVTVLRYFTVYGPAGRPDMSVFRFIKWIAESEPVIVLGDGTQKRDFTYVDDIAEGTLKALEQTPMDGYETINLGSDHPVELNDLIYLIETALGQKSLVERKRRQATDMPATWADIGRAKVRLGWEPKVRIEEGVRRAVSWYRENQVWVGEIRV